VSKVNNFTSSGAVTLDSTTVTVGDSLYGVSIDAIVVGNPGHPNHLRGTAGNDFLDGGSSHDTLTGKGGDDLLVGGLGDDTFVFRQGSGHDVIADFGDNDSINLADYTRHGVGVKWHDITGGTLIELSTGDTITLLGVSSHELAPTSSGFVHQIVLG
jgi:Ca2+-binding RTX toxin-like protein